MNILDALSIYLANQGYSDVVIDMMPDPKIKKEVIGLIKWLHTVATINDGSGTHYIQIQVRRSNYDDAYKVCKELFELLDSGPDEKLINLSPDVFCITRPRRGPLLLERGENYQTFYCEIALWGKN